LEHFATYQRRNRDRRWVQKTPQRNQRTKEKDETSNQKGESARLRVKQRNSNMERGKRFSGKSVGKGHMRGAKRSRLTEKKKKWQRWGKREAKGKAIGRKEEVADQGLPLVGKNFEKSRTMGAPGQKKLGIRGGLRKKGKEE